MDAYSRGVERTRYHVTGNRKSQFVPLSPLIDGQKSTNSNHVHAKTTLNIRFGSIPQDFFSLHRYHRAGKTAEVLFIFIVFAPPKKKTHNQLLLPMLYRDIQAQGCPGTHHTRFHPFPPASLHLCPVIHSFVPSHPSIHPRPFVFPSRAKHSTLIKPGHQSQPTLHLVPPPQAPPHPFLIDAYYTE